MNKTFKYKGFVCYWNKEEERYELYSKEEWGYGKGYRTPEWDAGTVDECKEWIDGYWEDEDNELDESISYKGDPNWIGDAENFDEDFENKYFPKINPKKVLQYNGKYFCFDNGTLYMIYKNEDEIKFLGSESKTPWRVMDSIGLSKENWEDNPEYWMSKYAGEVDEESSNLIGDYLKYEFKESRQLKINRLTENDVPMVGVECPPTDGKEDVLDSILRLIQDEREAIKGYLWAVDSAMPIFSYENVQIINEIIADEQQHIKLLSKMYDNLAQERYKNLEHEDVADLLYKPEDSGELEIIEM